MTDDLDHDLRDRLAGLAAAVPVDAPGSMTAVIPRIRTGRTGRRLALGGLVPLVAIVAVGTVVAGLAKLGPFGPGATQGGNGPVASTATDGPFELRVRSAKARYVTGEPIEIEAALTYRGSSASIEISHSQGAHGGPLGFGIEEPVIGDLVVGPTWRESCERSTLVAGTPLGGSFAKSGAFSGDNPRADEYQAFFGDPVLRLSDGVWHVFAVAEFSLGDCGGERHALRADIVIDVEATSGPTDTPTIQPSPSTTATEGPNSAPLVGTATDGAYMLEIRADHGVYQQSEAINIAAVFRYAADAPAMTIRHAGNGPIGMGIDEPVYGLDIDPIWLLSCVPREIEPGFSLEQDFRKSGGVSASDPDYEFRRAFLEDPVLRLPPGTWHIYVVASFSEGDCGADGPELRAEIEILVLPDTDIDALP